MPSAPYPSNGHHAMVNTQAVVNSLSQLTNGQTGVGVGMGVGVSPGVSHHTGAGTGGIVPSVHHGGGAGVGVGVGGSHAVGQVSGGGATGGVNHHHQSSATLTNDECGIREVWASNLEDEFKVIRTVVQQYPYIAMDTEFPGVVARPIGVFLSNTDYLYQIMRTNIHLLKIIQLGLTFMDAQGKTPSGYSTWQFNFKFNLNEDMYSQESIDLLTNSGIQFKKHEEEGIDTNEFAVLLIGSGVVLCDNISWLSFHSGYDFGYLLRLLTGRPLPKKVNEFFELMNIFFPRLYDLKYLMKSTKDLKGGLQEIADQLELERKGPQHQAGSDSLLTGETFFKMREIFFEDDIEEKRYSGFIYGLKVVERNGALVQANKNSTLGPDTDDLVKQFNDTITSATAVSGASTTSVSSSSGTGSSSTITTSGSGSGSNSSNGSTGGGGNANGSASVVN